MTCEPVPSPLCLVVGSLVFSGTTFSCVTFGKKGVVFDCGRKRPIFHPITFHKRTDCEIARGNLVDAPNFGESESSELHCHIRHLKVFLRIRNISYPRMNPGDTIHKDECRADFGSS